MIGLLHISAEPRREETISQWMSQSRQTNTRSIGIWWSTSMTQWLNPSKEKIAIPPMQPEWPQWLQWPQSQRAQLLQPRIKIRRFITHSITKVETHKKVSSLANQESRHKKAHLFNSLPRPETPIQAAWYPQALPDPWMKEAKVDASVQYKLPEAPQITIIRICKMLIWISLIKMLRTQIIPLTSFNYQWG